MPQTYHHAIATESEHDSQRCAPQAGPQVRSYIPCHGGDMFVKSRWIRSISRHSLPPAGLAVLERMHIRTAVAVFSESR